MQDINPRLAVDKYETALSSENALEILPAYDVVVDGTDNFPTRYLVNDACVLLGKPNAYGSIFRFEGQATVFHHQGGPCYRCLYPEPPPPGLVPSCAEGGVLGILPAVIGSIQATEAVKIILGKGDSLSGRLLLYDALNMRFRQLRLRRNPECPLCGDNPTVKELIDYQQFCGIPQQAAQEATREKLPEITPARLKSRLDAGEDVFVLDVREPHEFEIANIPGTTLIPLGSLPQHVHELDSTADIVVHCKSGFRSGKAPAPAQGDGLQPRDEPYRRHIALERRGGPERAQVLSLGRPPGSAPHRLSTCVPWAGLAGTDWLGTCLPRLGRSECCPASEPQAGIR